jgi:diadenosine tetraphosphate (Ap4A) HIT family hydrolase
MTDCVFCTRAAQPPVLFETTSLYVVPDKYPLLPGHILVISRAHRRCHAESPREMEGELEAAAARVRRFLREAYGAEALTWENGVFGQTVFHAHLHLLPVPAGRVPASVDGHESVRPVAGWEPVRQHFAREGGYRYLHLGDQRRLLAGQDRSLFASVRAWLSELTGLRSNPDDWIRTTTPADVAEVVRRWQAWAGDPR